MVECVFFILKLEFKQKYCIPLNKNIFAHYTKKLETTEGPLRVDFWSKVGNIYKEEYHATIQNHGVVVSEPIQTEDVKALVNKM